MTNDSRGEGLFSSYGALVLVLTVGFLLRVRALGSVGIFGDEYYHIFNAVRFDDIPGFLGLTRQNPSHLLLDPLQTFLLARLSDRLWWLRFASVLWGLAAIAGLWRLGESPQERRLGIAAAALLAFSPLHIEWSRRVDFYALLAALAVWQTRALLRLADNPRLWKAYAAWSAVFLHAHPYAFVLGCLHGLYVGVAPRLSERTRAARAFLRAWVVAGVMFIPWFLSSAVALTHPRAVDFTLMLNRLPLGRFLRETPQVLSLASEFHSPFEAGGGLVPVVVAGGFVFLYLSSLVLTARKTNSPAVLFSHLAVPLGLACVVAIDRVYGFFFAPRQLVWILPFYLLTVAHGGLAWGAMLSRTCGRPVRAVLVAGAAMLFLAGAIPAYLESTWSQERDLWNCRRMAAYVGKFLEKGDSFIFENSVVAAVFLYHFDPRGGVPNLRGLPAGARRAGLSRAERRASWAVPQSGADRA